MPHRKHIDTEGLRLATAMRKAREGMLLTQGQMAYYFDISRECYWRWERYCPPTHKPTRMWIRHVIRTINKRAKHRRHDAKRGKSKRHLGVLHRSDGG